MGVIITRASELQELFTGLKKGASYGAATTHHGKLWPKLDGGGGGGCPVLTFAITRSCYEDDGEAAVDDLKRRIAAAKAARKKRDKLTPDEVSLAEVEYDDEA